MRMREFWKQDHLCDVTLKTDDGTEHRCHRLVLSAASTALQNLLGGRFQEVDNSDGVVGSCLERMPQLLSEMPFLGCTHWWRSLRPRIFRIQPQFHSLLCSQIDRTFCSQGPYSSLLNRGIGCVSECKGMHLIDSSIPQT